MLTLSAILLAIAGIALAGTLVFAIAKVLFWVIGFLLKVIFGITTFSLGLGGTVLLALVVLFVLFMIFS